MSAEPPPVAAPPDPFDAESEEVQARIRLLDWVIAQIGTDAIAPRVGDYVLATDGRILGVGPDLDELDRRVLAAEPELRTARLVAYRVPPFEY
jgi:hypothetical protein